MDLQHLHDQLRSVQDELWIDWISWNPYARCMRWCVRAEESMCSASFQLVAVGPTCSGVRIRVVGTNASLPTSTPISRLQIECVSSQSRPCSSPGSHSPQHSDRLALSLALELLLPFLCVTRRCSTERQRWSVSLDILPARIS